MASDDEQPTASLVGGGSSDAAAYDGDEVVPPLPPSFASDEKPESPAPEDPYGALDEPMSGEGAEDVTPDSVKKRAEEQDEKEAATRKEMVSRSGAKRAPSMPAAAHACHVLLQKDSDACPHASPRHASPRHATPRAAVSRRRLRRPRRR